MKNTFLLTLAIVLSFTTFAQNPTTVIPVSPDTRVITTGAPFLLIAPDARAAAMGDMGVATSADAFSQQWNASKYAFITSKQGVAVSYTPYLSKLVDDIFLGNVTYFNRLSEYSSFAASFKYFSLGDIEIITEEQANSGVFTPLIERPNELTIDASYALRLSEEFSMGVTLRYLRSDLKIGNGTSGTSVDGGAANTFGADISGYYQTEEQAYNDFNGRWRAGFAIQNIGPKFKYDEGGSENFQPTTLRLGGGFDFIMDEYNSIALTAEVTKLLVPTPPVYGEEREYVDNNGNGTYDEDEDDLGGVVNSNYIIEGSDPNVGFLSGMFSSFGDAPGGFSEEIKEFTWALGAEYKYQDSFAFRAGFFNESDEKGARKFFALGAGFQYNIVDIDLSYLFSASKIPSPLENTLRFSLTFNIGRDTYDEF